MAIRKNTKSVRAVPSDQRTHSFSPSFWLLAFPRKAVNVLSLPLSLSLSMCVCVRVFLSVSSFLSVFCMKHTLPYLQSVTEGRRLGRVQHHVSILRVQEDNSMLDVQLRRDLVAVKRPSSCGWEVFSGLGMFKYSRSLQKLAVLDCLTTEMK